MGKTEDNPNDDSGSRHPRRMFVLVALLTILTALVLLYHFSPPTVLYQGF